MKIFQDQARTDGAVVAQEAAQKLKAKRRKLQVRTTEAEMKEAANLVQNNFRAAHSAEDRTEITALVGADMKKTRIGGVVFETGRGYFKQKLRQHTFDKANPAAVKEEREAVAVLRKVQKQNH